MTMQHIKCDDDHGAWLDRFTGKFVRTKGYAADGRNGWIETMGLVYDRSRDRKAIGKNASALTRSRHSRDCESKYRVQVMQLAVAS